MFCHDTLYVVFIRDRICNIPCTTVRDSVFKLVCKVPNFAIKFELWIK